MAEAYGALALLFQSLTHTFGGTGFVSDPGTLLALGHSVSVMLDGITDGPTPGVQIKALIALDKLWHCLQDPEVFPKFFPGAVSALTKSLTPSSRLRRSKKFIVQALKVFKHILTSTLNDVRTSTIKKICPNIETPSVTDHKNTSLTADWLKLTTDKVKLALSVVTKLRNHQSEEVCQALNKFCLSILDECHSTLIESSRILVETCMTLNGINSVDTTCERTTNLTDLALIHSDLAEVVRDVMYEWITDLPRVMQANDEAAKVLVLRKLSRTQELLVELNIRSPILEKTLHNSLRDSITVATEPLVSSRALEEIEPNLNSQALTTWTMVGSSSSEFQPTIMLHESQTYTRKELLNFVASLGTRLLKIGMANDMLEYTKSASGDSVLSAYWLCFQLLKSSASTNQELDELIDELLKSSLTQYDQHDLVEQELFLYSLSQLTTNNDEIRDWRLQLVAIEVVAERAKKMQRNFRLELVDALYAIVQILGSRNPRLRGHAITCLNIISQSCGYNSPSDLIIDNVDYMVNAISLQLNSFSIAPQAPQVLVMLIRLTGPSLILYLDDLIKTIFAALENYHGCQNLVDVLFSVLMEIVSVGSNSAQLRIANGELTLDHCKKSPPIITLEDIIETYVSPKHSAECEFVPSHEPFPEAPWKADEPLDELCTPPQCNEDHTEATEIQKPAPTKTYLALLSIVRTTQYFLTSPSPMLRSKLLGLISESANALSFDQDSFLPLVNDVWPVIIKRLYDSEAYVCIAACHTVANICMGAGDFLASRISTEWCELMRLARISKQKAMVGSQGRGAKNIYSQGNRMWEAIVVLLTAVVKYVKIMDIMYDQVLELFGSLVWERPEILQAMENINADAVWLAMRGLRASSVLTTPKLKNYKFACQ
ncbi:hypothetical protein BGHDH14_bgh04151 [Blumeria hordei DH14]|uniref:HEAT repeat protein n=1 Tax=Blumeria graminis f. sp. hordei (strain DH14) TaxID=546991 RepID=N1JBV6_BLUG1|nr:hypothetical protein BGHDH14_bgh04151 [Blumeria hordei DH14]